MRKICTKQWKYHVKIQKSSTNHTIVLNTLTQIRITPVLCNQHYHLSTALLFLKLWRLNINVFGWEWQISKVSRSLNLRIYTRQKGSTTWYGRLEEKEKLNFMPKILKTAQWSYKNSYLGLEFRRRGRNNSESKDLIEQR